MTVRALFASFARAQAGLDKSRTEFATEVAAGRMLLDDQVEQEFIDRIDSIPEICREVTLVPEPVEAPEETEPTVEVEPEPTPAPEPTVEPTPEPPAA